MTTHPEPRTTVVNVKNLDWDDWDVYIGRQVNKRAPDSRSFRRSIWANPYKIGRDGTREEVIAKYRDYVISQPELMAKLPELRGKRLGCWCAPAACHGDVLAELANAIPEPTPTSEPMS